MKEVGPKNMHFLHICKIGQNHGFETTYNCLIFQFCWTPNTFIEQFQVTGKHVTDSGSFFLTFTQFKESMTGFFVRNLIIQDMYSRIY